MVRRGSSSAVRLWDSHEPHCFGAAGSVSRNPFSPYAPEPKSTTLAVRAHDAGDSEHGRAEQLLSAGTELGSSRQALPDRVDELRKRRRVDGVREHPFLSRVLEAFAEALLVGSLQ